MCENHEALTHILEIADAQRVQRAADRTSEEVTWNGQFWTAFCRGARNEIYTSRITLVPRRAFNCNCQDRKRADQVGPCKHVISLAQAGLRQMAS